MVKDFKTAVVVSEDHLSLMASKIASYIYPSFDLGHLERVGFHLLFQLLATLSCSCELATGLVASWHRYLVQF